MSPIKDFSLSYEALNPEGFFSEGDTITGTVTLTLTKDTKVNSLFVKLKGDARVRWTEEVAGYLTVQRAHKRYFKVKKDLVSGDAKTTVLPRGVNHLKFSLTFPLVDMPSSFKGEHGKIVYMLQAKLSRPWCWTSKVQCKIMFISKSLQHFDQYPQYGSVKKEMGIFSHAEVKMFVIVDRLVYSPGDTVSVVVRVHNASSKNIRPKFSLHQNIHYRATWSTRKCVQRLLKNVGDTITAKTEDTASCQLKIPADAIFTLVNCKLVSVEYWLKVYLDISFAVDPEVMFPLVIVPSAFANPPENPTWMR